MSKKSGYSFQKEISQSLQKLKEDKYFKYLYWERIVDTRAYGVKCYRCHAPLFPKMMMPKQPADHLFIINGKICYLEEKSTENPVSYNITWIKPHQMRAGFEIEDAGGFYYFLLCKRIPYGMECYAITPDNFSDAILQMEYKNNIKWKMIADFSNFKLIRDMKLKTWDLSPIISKVKNGVK